jgi:hypothetical protein
MTERSGCGLVELTVLESLEAQSARHPDGWALSADAVAAVEERIGLGPRHGYQVLVELAQHWVMPVPLVAGRGNFGSRDFDQPANARYTESRPSAVGGLVLDAEAGRLAPVPVGLVNGSLYRGGNKPPLEPSRVISALRALLADPLTADAELLGLAGPPYSVAGSEIAGDLDALGRGAATQIVETARITVTGVPVSDPDPPAEPVPGGKRVFVLTSLGVERDRPRFAAHLVIDSLPAATGSSAAVQAIASRVEARRWRESHPELARRAGLPGGTSTTAPASTTSRSTSSSNRARIPSPRVTCCWRWTASARMRPGTSAPRWPGCCAPGSSGTGARTSRAAWPCWRTPSATTGAAPPARPAILAGFRVEFSFGGWFTPGYQESAPSQENPPR